MNDLDKLRVVLPHWIEHNSGHGGEFDHWAAKVGAAGRQDVAELLQKAAAALSKADGYLREALRAAGGPHEKSGHGGQHHHHHH